MEGFGEDYVLPSSSISNLGNVTIKEFRLHLTLKRDYVSYNIVRTDYIVWHISDEKPRNYSQIGKQLNIKIRVLEHPKIEESLPQYVGLLCLGSCADDKFVVVGHRSFYNFYNLACNNNKFDISQSDKLFCPFLDNQMHQQLVFIFKIDLASMLDKGQLSDATLVVCCKDQSHQDFHVHKAILSARSPVFATEFERVTAVTRTCIQVDLTCEIVRLEDFADMLRYIYTGLVASVQERNLDGLIHLAKQYQLSDMEEAFKKQMKVLMKPENAPGLLIDADGKKASWHKSLLINYIIKNLNLVIEKEGYNTMVKSHPHLLDEILRTQAQKLTSKRSHETPTGDGNHKHRKFKKPQ
ncbi:BTB and MATH domain-containing protein 43-like [Nasonia vitripennis]|uniref:BTB domain-containing protein n=1 Tax=Nasonia vitripennis TaxID=7425 RepID=A0A7M7H4B8_NASVI|nr:BTB and MATH domain-containing protein 43-like [Nasonia vitripennis]